MKHPVFILNTLVCLVALSSAEALAQRTAVGVRFTLADPGYRANYRPAEIDSIEKAGADLITQKLARDIGFVTFGAPTAPGYLLTFSLARRNRTTTTGADELGIYAKLEGPQIPGRDLYWFPFRTIEQFNQPKGLPKALLANLKLKAATADAEALTKELLTQIPITKTGFFIGGQRTQWVLPFKRKDLCLGATSTLRIENKINTAQGEEVLVFSVVANGIYNPAGTIPANIRADRHSVLGIANPPQVGLDQIRRGTPTVVVQAVYVDRYQYDLGVCTRPVDPQNAFTGGGQ